MLTFSLFFREALENMETLKNPEANNRTEHNVTALVTILNQISEKVDK